MLRSALPTTFLLLCGCMAVAPGLAPNVAQPMPTAAPASVRAESAEDFAARMLAVHNRHRATVGVPPLAWDSRLAADAQLYGPQLARLERLVHSPRDSRRGQGENLWMGSAGAFRPEAMVENWAEERTMFRRGIFPNVSTTGNWVDVAHYTQMIWRGTTHVGCALHRSSRWDYLICRYTPPGNRDGQAVP